MGKMNAEPFCAPKAGMATSRMTPPAPKPVGVVELVDCAFRSLDEAFAAVRQLGETYDPVLYRIASVGVTSSKDEAPIDGVRDQMQRIVERIGQLRSAIVDLGERCTL